MLKGIQTSTTAMEADEAWQQILANDLAQLNTPGYKSESAVLGSFQQALVERTGANAGAVGVQSGGTALVATVQDFSAGPLQQTQDPLDAAIAGQGFFAVQTPAGVRYTQDGAFALDAKGDLVTAQGYLVLSTAGKPLRAGPGAAIKSDGTLTVNGLSVGRIGVFNPATAQLTDTGGGLFAASGAAPAVGTALQPGYLEGSNVSTPEVLASMIQVLRHFQAGQQDIDQTSATYDRFLEVAG